MCGIKPVHNGVKSGLTPTLAELEIAYDGGRSLDRPFILISHILSFFRVFDLE